MTPAAAARPGAVAAITGALSFGGGAATAGALSLLYDGAPRPMALLIAAAAGAALLLHWLGPRPRGTH